MSHLSISTRSDGSATVQVNPVGEIDSDNCHQLREAVSGLLATESPSLIRVDMSLVPFIDSVGVGALVACYHAAAASGVRLIVTNPTAYVHRILYISGLLGLFGSPARLPERGGRRRQPAGIGD